MSKYPLADKFLDEHPGMTIDQAIQYLDLQIKKLGGGAYVG